MKVRVGIFLKILDDWTNHLSHLIIPTVGASYQPRSPLVIWTPTEASSREEQKQHFYQGKLSVLFFALPSMKYTPQFWYNSYLSSIYANLLRTCRCWFQTNRQVVASISQKGAVWFNLYGLTWTGKMDFARLQDHHRDRTSSCKPNKCDFNSQSTSLHSGQSLSMGRRVAQLAIHWGTARIGTFALYSTLLLLV